MSFKQKKNYYRFSIIATLLALFFNFFAARFAWADTPTINGYIAQNSPSPIQIAAGSSNVTFAIIGLTNPQSSAVTTISGLQIISDQDINTLLYSIRIYDGDTQIGQSIASLSASQGNYSQFLPISNFSIPGYGYKALKIVADVGSYPNKSVNLRLGIGGVSFLGSSVTNGFPVYGNSMGISTITSNSSILRSSLYSETPLSSTWKSGEINVAFSKIRLDADNASVSISSLTLYTDSNPAGLLSSIKIYDGATLLSTVSPEFSFSNNVYSKTVPVSISISASSFKLLTLSADVLLAGGNIAALRLGLGSVVSTAGTVKGLPSYGYAMTLTPKSGISTPAPIFNDGDVVQDGNTIYVIEYGKKRGLPSMTVFNRLGYSSKNITKTDTTGVPAGEIIVTGDQRHPRGSLVVDKGTIYFLGKDVRYPFPSAEIFLSWGNRFEKVVPANSYDASLPLGPLVQLKTN